MIGSEQVFLPGQTEFVHGATCQNVGSIFNSEIKGGSEVLPGREQVF